MRHIGLTIYLAAVMLMVNQPWNFWLIAIGIACIKAIGNQGSRTPFLRVLMP